MVERITIRGPSGPIASLEGPAWSQVEDALRSLDAEKETDLTLQSEEQGELVIIGGSGWYLVSLIRRTGETFDVIDRTKPSFPVQLKMGARPVEYDSQYLCDLETAIRAARRFFETGQMEESLCWE